MNNPIIRVDEWRPNYARKCENCDATPCVQGWNFAWTREEVENAQGDLTKSSHKSVHDTLVYDGTMCGVCTWGSANCIDPANW